ncbi:MAG: hypothetical protein ISS47_04880 [Candidatus Omnitrophica bacterium]|nr:hypothetical protein [Candidatus Omnitrophota bacterium]
MKIKTEFLIKFLVVLVLGITAIFLLKKAPPCQKIIRHCPYGEGGHCVGDRYFAYIGEDTDCSQTPFPCGNYTCCKPCIPAPCLESDQSEDNDNDGWTDQCSDCASSVFQTFEHKGRPELINPASNNPYCDCNPQTPSKYPSTVGVSELTNCHLNESKQAFSQGCLCSDGIDNDCDGLVDLDDPDCPIIGKDIIIESNIELTKNKDISPNGLYVFSGKLKIKSEVTLTVGENRGIYVGDGGRIELEEGARIILKE